MNLTIYRPGVDEEQVDNPTSEQIASLIQAMNDDHCVVLTQDEDTFMQAVLTRDQGLVLEHQEGGTDNFFVAQGDVTHQAATEAMLDYLTGGSRWRDSFSWKQVNLLAYLNADFTMLTYVSAEALTQGGFVEFEDFYEMPYIGVHHLITLFQLLCGGEYEELEEEFDILGEADLDEENHALLYIAPEPFFLALESVTESQIPELAENWWNSEYFPQDVAHVDDVAELLQEISAMARKSAANSSVLIVCEVESGDIPADE